MSEHENEPRTEDEEEQRELSDDELDDVAGGKGIQYDTGQPSP